MGRPNISIFFVGLETSTSGAEETGSEVSGGEPRKYAVLAEVAKERAISRETCREKISARFGDCISIQWYSNPCGIAENLRFEKRDGAEYGRYNSAVLDELRAYLIDRMTYTDAVTNVMERPIFIRRDVFNAHICGIGKINIKTSVMI